MESFHPHRGFTLIELLVVLGIITVMMSLVTVSQGSFNKTLMLSNTAYDVALTIRSAENFGLGGRLASGLENTGYGVEFTSATPASFITFADTSPAPNANNCHGLPHNGSSAPNAQPGDCIYKPADEQQINEYTLGNALKVTQRCALSGTTWTCGLSSLDIVFARPNPTPFIRANGVPNTPYSKACLTISSQQGTSRFITILSSGEIDANAPSDPNSCHG